MGVAAGGVCAGGRLELRKAVQAGDAKAVSRLVRVHGANPDVPGAGGRSLLSQAVSAPNALAVTETLLVCGARVNRRDRRGRTALFAAVRNPALTALLLRYDANPSLADRNGWTPLMEAVVWGDSSVVRQLLAAGADPNVRDLKGNRPLALAAKKPRTVGVLLDAGARMDGLTPAERLSFQAILRRIGKTDSSFCELLRDDLPRVVRSVQMRWRGLPSSLPLIQNLCLVAEECLGCCGTFPAAVRTPLAQAVLSSEEIRGITPCASGWVSRRNRDTADVHCLMATAAVSNHLPRLALAVAREGLKPGAAAKLLSESVRRRDAVAARISADIVRLLDAGKMFEATAAARTALGLSDSTLLSIVLSSGVRLTSSWDQERAEQLLRGPQPAEESQMTAEDKLRPVGVPWFAPDSSDDSSAGQALSQVLPSDGVLDNPQGRPAPSRGGVDTSDSHRATRLAPEGSKARDSGGGEAHLRSAVAPVSEGSVPGLDSIACRRCSTKQSFRTSYKDCVRRWGDGLDCLGEILLDEEIPLRMYWGVSCSRVHVASARLGIAMWELRRVVCELQTGLGGFAVNAGFGMVRRMAPIPRGDRRFPFSLYVQGSALYGWRHDGYLEHKKTYLGAFVGGSAALVSVRVGGYLPMRGEKDTSGSNSAGKLLLEVGVGY